MRILTWASQPEQMFRPDSYGAVSFDLYSNAALASRPGRAGSIEPGPTARWHGDGWHGVEVTVFIPHQTWGWWGVTVQTLTDPSVPQLLPVGRPPTEQTRAWTWAERGAGSLHSQPPRGFGPPVFGILQSVVWNCTYWCQVKDVTAGILRK